MRPRNKMKQKGIYRWLSEVQTQRNPNTMSPSASDVFDDEYEPTASKRRKMSPSKTSSVQEERQTSSGVSSPTLFTCQSSECALSVHSSSAPSPQELLSELSSSRPPVFYQGEPGIPISQSIASLREVLLKDIGSKVIPAGLKGKILEAAPEQTTSMPDRAFDDTGSWSPEQLESLWEVVHDIYTEAKECSTYHQDSNAWCSGVVDKILRISLRHNPLLQLKDIKSQAIQTEILPELPRTGRIKSNVNYAFALSVRGPEINEALREFAITQPELSLGLTTDLHLREIPTFAGIVVKDTDGDREEARLQLTIWFAAQFEKFIQLSNYHGKGIDERHLPPVIGWTVVGHNWYLYIGYRGVFEGDERIYIQSPLSAADILMDTSTLSYYGIFKIIDLVRRVASYLENVHWSLFYDKILHSPGNREC